MALPNPNIHRVVITFDDGIQAKLICPESGCVPVTICSYCNRNIEQTDERCPQCPSGEGECWLKMWADADDLLEYTFGGSVTVPIEFEWDGDGPSITVVTASPDGPTTDPQGEALSTLTDASTPTNSES